MKKLMLDFKSTKEIFESWYDLEDDWGLIEASLATQYGIRIRHHNDMPWDEFCNLVSGLMPETPLGNIVTVRSEKDPKVVNNFTPHQKRIYSAWRRKQASNLLKDKELLDKSLKQLTAGLKQAFGKKEVKNSE
jgi:hypothetical protein